MPRSRLPFIALGFVAGMGYGVEQSLDAHWRAGEDSARRQLAMSGMVATSLMETSLGLERKQIRAAILKKKGSTLKVELDLGASPSIDDATPVLLEIQEVHQAQRQAFAYAVEVDGVRIYVRTFAELLPAPMSWFAKVDRSLIRNPHKIQVSFINLSDTPVALANVWGHNDFYRQARAQGLASPLRVLTYVDNSADSSIQFPSYHDFTRGVMYGTRYFNTSNEYLNSTLDKFLIAAQSHHCPFALMQSRWWGHTGMQANGLGGYYGDIRHNQVVYNQAEDRFHLTTPNMWGNTPWQSLNDDVAMRLSQKKLQRSVQYFSDLYALMRAQDPTFTFPDLVMEWGVSYWERGGDFSGNIVAAARADGVTLDPKDGLDAQEIAWMQNNIASYNDKLAKTYKSALGSDAIVVRDGVISPPSQQLFDHVFTHTLEAKLFPSYDDRLPGWVGGMGPNMWPSSEMYQFTDPRHHLYSLSSGRLACANLEMAMIRGDELSNYLRRGYANGMEFVALFNPKKDPTELEKQVTLADQLDDARSPDAPEYQNPQLDLDFLRDSRRDFMTNPPNGFSAVGLSLVLPNSNTAMSDGFLRQSDPQVPGQFTCRLTDSDQFSAGLRLRIEGRTVKGTIDILAGSNPNKLQSLGQFTMGNKLSWFNFHAADIINLDAIARGNHEVYVRLVLSGEKGDTSVRAIQAYRPWAYPTGRLHGQPDTYGERRLQSTWIQQRAVGERLRKSYVDKAGREDAVCQRYDDLVRDNRLNDGIKLLAAEISQVLPARFAVVGRGPLGRLPIEIQLPTAKDAAVVTVMAHSETATRLAVFSVNSNTIRLRWRDGEKHATRIVQDGPGLWTISWQPGQELESWSALTIEPPSTTPMLPRSSTFRARIDRIMPQQLLVETQDLTLGDFANAQFPVALAKGCTFQRGDNTTTASPQLDDLAEITVDNQGQATAIRLREGVIRGRITEFSPAPLQKVNPHNGRITLDNGMVFELSYNKDHTRLDLTKLKGLAIAHDISIVEQALQPGLNVEITYTPDYPAGIPPRIRAIRQLTSGE